MSMMKNFNFATLVALLAFVANAAVVEPFAFFSFTNGTVGASAVGTFPNEVNPGTYNMTIAKNPVPTYSTTPPAFEAANAGKIVFATGDVLDGVLCEQAKSVRLASTGTSGQAGKITIAGAASEFSNCHGTGYTFEFFYNILPTDTFSRSGNIYIGDAGYKVSGSTQPFKIFFTKPQEISYGLNSLTGLAHGSFTLQNAINDGLWHHFALVETPAAHLEIWIDYVRYADIEIPLSSVTLTTTTGKGIEFANQFLQGRFTCFRLTKKALSRAEFMHAATRGHMKMSDDVMAFYPFDEGVPGEDANATAVCNAASPTFFSGLISANASTSARVTYDSDAPAKFVFENGAYGAKKIYENPMSVHMTNRIVGTSGTIEFRELSTELSKYHATGSTIEYFVKVDDGDMTKFKPSLISDAGYLQGATEKPLNVFIPYDGANQINYSLGDYDASDISYSGMHPDGMVNNGWHHVAVVEQDRKIRLYVDYVQYGEISVPNTKTLDSQGGTIKDNVRNLVLGNYLQHCKLSCLRIMKRALKPSEFMYASNLPTCVPRTVFHWPLDEASRPPLITNIVSTYYAANPDLYISRATEFTGMGVPMSETAMYGLSDKCRYARCDVVNGDVIRREDVCCQYFRSADPSPVSASYRNSSNIRIAANDDDAFALDSAFSAEAFFKFDQSSWTNSTSPYSRAPYDRVVLMSRIGTNDGVRVAWAVSLAGAANPQETKLRLDSSWAGGSATTESNAGDMGDGRWHHIAVTYDPTANKMRAYCDYRPVLANALGGTPDCGSLGYIGIGDGPAAGGNGFMGWVDEVRYSRSCLLPSQFLQLENHRGISLFFH